MALCNRYSLLLTSLLWMLAQGVWCQLAKVSEAQIPRDKVFAVQGDVGIAANNSQGDFTQTVLFDVHTGAIISSVNGRVLSEFSHGDIHYFLIRQGSHWSPSTLYTFEQGELLSYMEEDEFFGLEYNSFLESPIGISAVGFSILTDGLVTTEVLLGARPRNIFPHSTGYLAAADSGYFKLNGDLEVLESVTFPQQLVFMGGEAIDGWILLRGAYENSTLALFLYNVHTHELKQVTHVDGEDANLASFITYGGIYEGQFFMAGCGLTVSDPSVTMAFPTYAGFVDPVSSTYTPANERISLWQVLVRPVMVSSANGPVVFGRMGIEGIEPYTFKDGKLEVIKDIYRGFGSSIAFDRLYQSHWWNPGSHPNAIEVIADDGLLYFAARSDLLGKQVWRSDGTEAGTYAITGFDLANKGLHKCFIGKDAAGILFTSLERNGERRLYRTGFQPEPVEAELDESRNWEVVYAKNPLTTGGTFFFETQHLDVHLASDGSSMTFINRLTLWDDFLSYNQHWVLPQNKIQGFYANSLVQITQTDGTLKSSAVIRARDFIQRTAGRSKSSGHVFVAVSNRPLDTFVNEEMLPSSQDGHYLIELNNDGTMVNATLLPTGGQNRISFSQIEVTDEGIYLLGFADRQFNLGGAYQNTIAQQQLRPVIIKYNLNHTFQWIADAGNDIEMTGQGVNTMKVVDNAVFATTGGTAYNVSSSCAFADWPYQISCLDAGTGNHKWHKKLESTDIVRITAMELVDDQWLWLTGYTRGDLSIDDRYHPVIDNYLGCSYNGFMLSLNKETGSPAFFTRTDPSRAKFIQGIRLHEEHLYTLSMVYEEELFPVPIWGHDGRWNLQLDKYTDGGLHVDSLLWPTSISRFDLGERLRDVRFNFDFHPEGGVVISGQEVNNGMIDAFTSPSSEATRSSRKSWLLQRRDIDALIQSTLPPQPPEAALSDFEMFPNPLVGSALTLVIPTALMDKYDRIILTDIQGRRCMEQNLSGPFESRLIEIDGGLANGVYLVELVGTSRSSAKKLVLRR